jgi:5-methylcytosine-specific restriction protein B
MWISESKDQYAIIPVGADWTNREPLLGYPNSLIKNHYVKPESGVLDILIRAHKEYKYNKNDLIKCKPYFLILDEMNLSHVERYFADFLSAMESGDMINLYSDGERYSEFNDNNEPIIDSLIPENISLPKNLFIIGTVNIDETTYMFSPKVLDRANTIEFRVTPDEMLKYLKESKVVDMNLLLEDANSHKGKGSVYSNKFMNLAARNGISVDYKKHSKTFLDFFTRLKLVGAEFGYRTANEMVVLVTYLEYFGLHLNEAYDIAIMQKLLPKINGSRSKLVKALPELAALCIKSNDRKNVENIFKGFIDNGQSLDEFKSEISFPLSFEKLCRMYKNAQENGFASYAEA